VFNAVFNGIFNVTQPLRRRDIVHLAITPSSGFIAAQPASPVYPGALL
jgi:hypothetical protein